MTDTMNRLALTESAQDLLFRNARTANSFTGEPVDDDQIKAIYDLIQWAPTSMNQQPLRIVLVRDPDARERLVECMFDNNQAKTRTAPLTAVLAADTAFTEHMPAQFPVFPQAGDVLYGDPQVRTASARFNATIQVGYFILGIRAAGLAAGPMSGFDPGRVAAAFFPDGRYEPLCVVNIGKPGPQAWFPRLPRLDYDQVVTTV